MNRTVKLIALAASILVLGFQSGHSQSNRVLNTHLSNYVFNADSLAGFEEAAAQAGAISEGFVGNEFPVRMWQLKRRYINDKYNLQSAKPIKHVVGGINYSPSSM